jgi:hypothetical protein
LHVSTLQRRPRVPLQISKPLGIGSGEIPDEHITASSVYRAPYALYNPWFGRAFTREENPSEGAWCAGVNAVGEFLQVCVPAAQETTWRCFTVAPPFLRRACVQVDLGRDYSVTAVATQGRAGFDQWVTSFSLLFSRDGTVWAEVRRSVPGVEEGYGVCPG